MTQNVVIYTVVIDVDNSELKLLPYLTADVYFEVDSRKDVLLVPNAALRFKPTPEQIDSQSLAENPELTTAPSARSSRREKKDAAASNTGRLWVVVPGTDKLRSVEVQTGVSDLTTSLTEITGGDLKEGDEIVVGENRQADGRQQRRDESARPAPLPRQSTPIEESKLSDRCDGTHSPGQHL